MDKVESFTAKVTNNPAKPGKATESLTAQSISKCTTNVSGIKVMKVGAKNLPYKVTVGDGKDDPVAVSASKKSKPVELFATAGARTPASRAARPYSSTKQRS